MIKNVLLKIAYDGSEFHGWQRQPGDRTVQGEVEKALSHTLGTAITIDGTSRTDAGVHALGQQATFQCDMNVPVDKLPMILNNSFSCGRICGERIAGDLEIIDAVEVAPEFHARFDAIGKKYVYKILNTSKPDIFKRNFYYQISQPLDIAKMEQAAKHMVGSHDFKSFEASGSNKRETTVRTINSLKISSTDQEIRIEIVGDGFLYNMVRIITGTLVEVGLMKINADSIPEILTALDRKKAGHTAPPSGLYLQEVYYKHQRNSR